MNVFEKIIDKLEEYPTYFFGASLADAEAYIKVNDLMLILQELAAEYNNGWITCSERLPETEEYILLSFENFSVPIVGRYEEDEEGGAFYAGDEEETCASQGMFANAWQPLPESYKPKVEQAAWKEAMMRTFANAEESNYS